MLYFRMLTAMADAQGILEEEDDGTKKLPRRHVGTHDMPFPRFSLLKLNLKFAPGKTGVGKLNEFSFFGKAFWQVLCEFFGV